MVRVYRDSVMVIMPMVVDMGSIYAGLRCGIIGIIVNAGRTTEDVVSKTLRAPISKVHETLRRMEDEGTVLTMCVNGSRTSFLTDRNHWAAIMMADPVIHADLHA